jgi:two-component sensor histidine kinase
LADSTQEHPPGEVEQLLDTEDLASALEDGRFKQFLDHVPVAIAVSDLEPSERVVYANAEFERLAGRAIADFLGGGWDRLLGETLSTSGRETLAEALIGGLDSLGSFTTSGEGRSLSVDAWASLIDGDDGAPAFRLLALVESTRAEDSPLDDLEAQVREKDMQLRELQHRVKNNLQMITALIRVEARGISDHSTSEGFDRLAGRVEALGLLYNALETSEGKDSVDLGVYLSQIAAAVMTAHATEGVHLDLQVDSWPVSIDVAMPTGLVVNELLTNALKHAFRGRNGGTITLHCLMGPDGCRVVVADDGVGLADGVEWPRRGKLSALIVRSLLQNAKAQLDVQSEPGHGLRVTIRFRPENAAPTAPS